METGTDLVFRSAASDAYQGVALAELALAKGITDMSVSYANDDYNAGLAAVFAEHYAANGGKIHLNEAHEPNKASYRSEVATLGANTDNLALFAYYGSGGITLMRNAMETSSANIPSAPKNVENAPVSIAFRISVIQPEP